MTQQKYAVDFHGAHQAKLDRSAWTHPKLARGNQMAFAMVDGLLKNPQHPFGDSIGRVVASMERRG